MKKLVTIVAFMLMVGTLMQACSAARCPAYSSYPKKR